MHELPVAERILNTALQHAAGSEVARILVIHLRIGELSDVEDEWLQRYFDYLSRGTLAEDARLAIERAPIVLSCDSCCCSFEIKKEELKHAGCPECGESRCRLISGREYFVKNMEVV
jgi:hydrogenase nickel incorporation protein HypA/HybF